jgi:molecular chaperone HscC
VIVGIDLGTTNSLLAVFDDGRPRLIPNAHGHMLTPSAVALQEDGSMLVGLPAREMLSTEPRAVATQFKRWMGTDKLSMLRGRAFRPEELSACVLRSLKADAEAALGARVEEAVITVPAYFNDAQRKATRIAGELAGLRVERLLNEPTAAGLAYGLLQTSGDSTLLVFDLGGGTFDVSVLERFDGIVQVRASAGDTRLGGEDFNDALLQIASRHVRGDAERALAQAKHKPGLWRSLEQAKRKLSEAESAELALELQDGNLSVQVSRAEFEAACEPLLQRMRRPIERALSDAGLKPTDLSEVLLVGRATRLPMVQRLVARLFQRLPLRSHQPDEVVALGAAVQAALKARDAAVDELVLTDVMPFSLGIITSKEIGGKRLCDLFSPIIERNSPVPISRVESYSTVEDNQKSIMIDIRQGESPKGSENLHLGDVTIEVPRRSGGQASVDVRFTYDVNGLLVVDVSEPSTKRTVQAVIKRSAEAMSDDQVAAALKRMETLKIHPKDVQENLYAMERGKRLYEDLLGHARELLAQELAVFEAALERQDVGPIAQARARLVGVMDELDDSFRI